MNSIVVDPHRKTVVPYRKILLVFSVTPFKIEQNKNQNRSDKVQKWKMKGGKGLDVAPNIVTHWDRLSRYDYDMGIPCNPNPNPNR